MGHQPAGFHLPLHHRQSNLPICPNAHGSSKLRGVVCRYGKKIMRSDLLCGLLASRLAFSSFLELIRDSRSFEYTTAL